MIKIDMPKDVERILDILEQNNKQGFIVGGCVRDSILNIAPHDWDICTSATPTEIEKIFKDYRIIETGIKHGTVTVIMNGEPYEITTYRIDGTYEDNRKPNTVTFTTDIVQDLSRRDFTINAMAYNLSAGLVDPFNGYDDCINKHLKCVGDANTRFNEDALRILRAIRFASKYGLYVEHDTMMAIYNNYGLLNNISKERINSELCQIIMTDNCLDYMYMYRDVIFAIIPELKNTDGFKQNNPYHIYDVFLHTLKSLEFSDNNLIVRLSVLFHDIGKPYCYSEDENHIGHFHEHGKISAEITDKIMKDLKFDNDTREKVIQLVGYHDATFECTEKHIKKWLNRIGESQFKLLLLVRIADILGQNPNYKQERLDKIDKINNILQDIIEHKDCFTIKDLDINGNDLISIGYNTGKLLGNTLNNLLNMVINNEIKNDKTELLSIAKGWL